MIDRAFIAVLLLSISGFIFCAVYMPLENLAYRHTSAKTMVTMNTIALFSFVFPLYLVVSFADGSESTFRAYDTLILSNADRYESFVFNMRNLDFTKYLGDLWFLGAIGTLFYRTWKYFRSLFQLASNKFGLENSVWSAIFEKIKQEKNVHNVFLVGSCQVTTPCTFGLRKRYIAIPAIMINSFEEDEIELILQHEFYHVIHRDLLRKFLIMLLGSIHWFNPLFRFLKDNLSNWQETACDEEVTKIFGKEEKDKYIQLFIKILEVQSEDEDTELISFSFIGNDLKDYKRRLEKVMRKSDKTSIRGKVVVASAALLSMFCGNVVAKAADIPVNQMFSKNVEIVEAGEYKKVSKIESDYMTASEKVEQSDTEVFVEFEQCNTANITYKIIYSNPEAATVVKQDQAEPRHAHNIVDMIWEKHEKFSNGSCKTTYYKGRECTICGATWRGDLIGETTLVVCPH